ncbi:hypothetical protein [Luteimonas arsenica]|uniref:hypothetical protein n=1 Tax=Luteimonas arsenica TaxID=1586242 RepID=UPI001056C83B|nr:hypothetical protein [Luteimonas arsenica]
MTIDPRHREDPVDPLPPPLAANLRKLRADVAPGRDLWPGIAAKLPPRAPGEAPLADAGPAHAAAPATAVRRGRHRFRRRNLGYAAAATIVLATAIGWQLLPVQAPPAPVDDPAATLAAATDFDTPLLHAADALAREYQGALREVQAANGATAATDGLDAELDRRAAEVRAALARDPDALHLFHRLQRIYAHRLALNLRQA